MAQTALSQPIQVGDVVKYETPMYFCRKTTPVVLTQAGATGDYEIGTVLEVSGGKYIKCSTGANAVAVLLKKITKAQLVAGDVSNVPYLYRGPAVVDKNRLLYTGDILAAVCTALEALGISCRAEPAEMNEGTDTSRL